MAHQRQGMPNKKLDEYLAKRADQPTVILSFRILLDHAIENGIGATMTKSQIEKIFNRDHSKFGIQTFRRDYVMRQSGNVNNAIDERNLQFFIRPEYLSGLTAGEMKKISQDIDGRYAGITDTQKKLYKEIAKTKGLPVEKRRSFIVDMLMTRETDKRGQNFEVTAFAILRTMYAVRGFELNRFSTIYSNDGGIDYTAQSAIYQVTTKLSDRKFEEDIIKTPLKKRIIVYKELVRDFDITKFEHELIIDYIGPEDLLSHIDYLLKKNAERNSLLILDAMEKEFEREYYIA